MTDELHASVPPGSTAGALLRAAREKQGVHIAVLAAAIKISPRKLDALEGDRYSELPDATFTRALAQTVCRALKIDPQPVLALLPQAAPAALDTVGEGLNTPFREKFRGTELSAVLPRAPLVWAALALIGAAALVYYWPSSPGELKPKLPRPAPPAAPAPSESPRVETRPLTSESTGTPAVAVPLPGDAASAAAAGAGQAASAVAGSAAAADAALASRPTTPPITVMPTSTGAALVVNEPVWLEVIDGTGAVVFQRTIQPGENLSFEQAPPLKLKIGNAAAAKLTFRGEPVDLAPFTRSNVARVVLK